MPKLQRGPCGKVKGKGCKCPTKGAGKEIIPEPEGGMKEVRSYPLSDSDLRTLLGQNINVITNRQLPEYNSIEDIFDDEGRCVLLYTPEDPQSGHYVCLLRRPDCIEYFDPYGEKPDNDDVLGDQPPILTQMLRESGIPVYWNTHQFQKLRGDISTCGRHVTARCLYAPYSLDKYAAIVKKSKMMPDDFVSGLTYDKLGK